MTRNELRGRVQTVSGVIAPETLGATLMHEHLICDIRTPALAACDCTWEPISLENHWAINYGETSHGPQYQLDMPEVIIDEVSALREEGGSAVVELSNGGLSPEPETLRHIAERTGVHVKGLST